MKHFVNIVIEKDGLNETRDIAVDAVVQTANIGLNESALEYEMYESENNTQVLSIPISKNLNEAQQAFFAKRLASKLFDKGYTKFDIEFSLNESALNEATLRRGSRGPEVEALQQQLGITVDGIFGPNTEAAVRAVQQRAGITVDGIAGGQTQAALSAGGSPRNAGQQRPATAPFTPDGGSTTQTPPAADAAPTTSIRPQARPNAAAPADAAPTTSIRPQARPNAAAPTDAAATPVVDPNRPGGDNNPFKNQSDRYAWINAGKPDIWPPVETPAAAPAATPGDATDDGGLGQRPAPAAQEPAQPAAVAPAVASYTGELTNDTVAFYKSPMDQANAEAFVAAQSLEGKDVVALTELQGQISRIMSVLNGNQRVPDSVGEPNGGQIVNNPPAVTVLRTFKDKTILDAMRNQTADTGADAAAGVAEPEPTGVAGGDVATQEQSDTLRAIDPNSYPKAGEELSQADVDALKSFQSYGLSRGDGAAEVARRRADAPAAQATNPPEAEKIEVTTQDQANSIFQNPDSTDAERAAAVEFIAGPEAEPQAQTTTGSARPAEPDANDPRGRDQRNTPPAVPTDSARAAEPVTPSIDAPAAAQSLSAAMRGFGTDEEAISQALQGIGSQQDWDQIKAAYDGDLLADLRSELNRRDYQRYVTDILQSAGVQESVEPMPKGAFMVEDRAIWRSLYESTHYTNGKPRPTTFITESKIQEVTFDDDDKFFEAYGVMWFNEDELIDEAEYQGRTVKLGKPMAGDVKKFKVYVKNPKGNVVKVNFGQKGARIKKDNPERRRSFRARHNCDNPGPRHKARYWSCRKW